MAAMSGEGSWRAWYSAARPRTLTATLAPLALAGVMAIDHKVFDAPVFALALLGALLLQVATNLINEYADWRRGTDRYKQAGQGMTIKQGVLPARSVGVGALLSLGGGVLAGLILLVREGPDLLSSPLMWIGVGGVLVAVAYTAGPLPLSRLGLGEVAAGVFMGPLMVLGAWYVQARCLTWQALLASLPLALMVAAILHANNLRDMEADRAVGKRTLAVRFGWRAARSEYLLLVSGSYVMLLLLTASGDIPWPALLALLTLPEALQLQRQALATTDVNLLHVVQGRTARLHGRFGGALALGWLLAAIAGVGSAPLPPNLCM